MIENLSNHIFWGILSALVVLAYVVYLIVISGKTRHKGLPIIIIFILLVGTLLHIGVIYDISGGERSWFSIIGISIVSSLEMFLGSSRIFDNGFQEFLFQSKNIGWLNGLTTVYILAVLTSAFLIVSFFFKRVESKVWLWWNRPSAFWNTNKKNQKAHIFFGLNNHSIELIQDISRRLQDAKNSTSGADKEMNKRIILIEYPRSEDRDYDASVFEKMHNLFSSYKRHDSLSNIESLVRLKSRIPLYDIHGEDVFNEIDLSNLSEWIHDEENTLYLVSDNEQENIVGLEKLHLAGVKCKHIYCHACIEGHNEALEEFYRNNNVHVTFIDSSFLSIQSLTKDANYKSSLPIRYVNLHIEKVEDDHGVEENRNAGYIDSEAFNSVILGFGETGQYALAFLYEYGAFVNKNREKVPFKCHIYDERIKEISHGFEVRHPGYDFAKEITWNKEKVRTEDFWKSFCAIKDINYIFICLGNDSLNLDVAYDISSAMRAAYPDAKYRIMIQLKESAEKNLNLFEDIKKKNPDHIGRFGLSNEIWTYQNISNALLNTQAKQYHDRYERHRLGLSADDPSYVSDWEVREEEIYSPETNPGLRRKRIRQRSQDYANCLHLSSKLYLIGTSLSVSEKELYANAILDLYDPTITSKSEPRTFFFDEEDCFKKSKPKESFHDFVKLIMRQDPDCEFSCGKHFVAYKILCRNSDGVVVGDFTSIPSIACFIEKEDPTPFNQGMTKEEYNNKKEQRLKELRIEIHNNGGIPQNTETRIWERVCIEATPFMKFVWEKLEYLAIYEHIRWEASHIARGYKLGEYTNDVIKEHDCIRDYYELDGNTQHYDWLVVKTTLDL